MDFDKISLIAFKEENMPNDSTILELLIYYMIKELYIKHYRKQINTEDAEKEKNKIKAYYEKELKNINFKESLYKKAIDNMTKSDYEIIQLIKLINKNEDIKEILDIAISCISNITSNLPLLTTYKEKY